ncbi:MAG: RIO1 family regulatory kinase/ATPase [Kineosporiaceae bacterium]
MPQPRPIDDRYLTDARPDDPTDVHRDDDAGLEPGLDAGDEPAWSSWGQAQHGPEPHPDWVITALGAIDTERGILKTGKEADVFLVERTETLDGDEPAERSTLMAAKRYRTAEHRLFHRDASYLEGRRVRRSRETRAMARRTDFGRELIAAQWAAAEFGVLAHLWQLTHGRPGTTRALVPYPVQLRDRELMMEFIGDDDGTAAPRLAQLRPEPDELIELWNQMLDALGTLALEGLAHGDLSAYNVLVHQGSLVLIDLPQAVDVVANPQGADYLARDVANIARWFRGHGLPEELCDPEALTADLLADAGIH